ncbi:MAG: right-handed parallel beta-helix repeat-containing protein [Cytophagales bacterium]
MRTNKNSDFMFKTTLISLFVFASMSTSLLAQTTEKEMLQILSHASDGQSIEINQKIALTEGITLNGLKNLEINGKENAELFTFNNIPHIIKLKDCHEITISNIRMRVGVKNVGGPIIVIENCTNILLDNLDLGEFGINALEIDELSKGIKLYNSRIKSCHDSGIKTSTASVDIRNNSFSSNSQIGRSKPDLDVSEMEGYPLVRYNSYRVSDYVKHKRTVDEFVQSRNTISYNFDCFKIVKKFEMADGSSGKLSAFYEGENNKILDKMELDYKGPKGQITASTYFLHENLVYTTYEIKKGKVEINYFVYGDFLEHLEKADSKASAHVSGSPDLNKKQFNLWLDAIESWLKFTNDEAEELALYKDKATFIALPY